MMEFLKGIGVVVVVLAPFLTIAVLYARITRLRERKK